MGYAGIVYGAVHAMRDDILDKATEATRSSGQHVVIRHPFEPYDGRDEAASLQLRFNIKAITREFPAYLVAHLGQPPVPADEHVAPVAEPAKRGRDLIALLSLFLRSYPLDETQFTSVSEVRQWVPEADEVLSNVLGDLETTWNFVVSVVEMYATEKDAKRHGRQDPPGASEAALMAHLDDVVDPRRLLVTFHTKLTEKYLAVADVKTTLARHDTYFDHLPSPQKIGAVFALAALAFVTGVAVPLIDTSAPRWIYVGVPLGVYLVAMIAVASFLVRWYLQRRDDKAGASP